MPRQQHGSYRNQKTTKTAEKLKNRLFHKNRFLTILNGIWEVWGCPGVDHTKRLSRTLAGFGLTGHGGSQFSCFWEILGSHFITKYFQIGPRTSRLVLGFVWKPGHQIKPIDFPKNDTNKYIFREPGQPPQIVIFK